MGEELRAPWGERDGLGAAVVGREVESGGEGGREWRVTEGESGGGRDGFGLQARSGIGLT